MLALALANELAEMSPATSPPASGPSRTRAWTPSRRTAPRDQTGACDERDTRKMVMQYHHTEEPLARKVVLHRHGH